MRTLLLVALVALLAAPIVPGAEAAAPGACRGTTGVTPPGEPDHVVTGTFDTSLEGAYVMVPFEVPPARKRVQLRLCHDQPDSPTSAVIAHTLDLGVYEPTKDGFWDTEELRGWGGSSRPEVVITPQGDNDEQGDGPADGASTTVGYLPGHIPRGTWAAEIGVAAVVGPDEGDPDGEVAWRLEIYTGDDPDDADEPWRPARYDDGPAVDEPGWYKGDLHVHARHSNPGDALMSEVFGYAFRDRTDEEEGAGLDFITLSDYVTPRHWDEIRRFQDDGTIPSDKLVIRSAEVITYRGHVNNHASLTPVDHRTGPVYEWPDLTEPIRRERSPNAVFDAIHASGTGWTQINHPTTFPATVPGFGAMCRGCSWEYEDTDWSKVDAFEVQTGPAGYTDPKGDEPGPNPFTPLAIEWFDRLHRQGHDVTAVGSSDSHHAGHEELTQSPVGEATTVVLAPELSEAGIRDGVLAGHAYVKFFSSDGPDLRLEARTDPGSEEPDAIMGDEADAPAWLTARVLFEADPRYPSAQPRTLLVLRDGAPILALPVASIPFEITVPAFAPGDYRLQLHRGTAIDVLTNPITLRSSD